MLGHLHHEFIERVPGAAGEPHQEFIPGGHFVQDDFPDALGATDSPGAHDFSINGAAKSWDVVDTPSTTT